MSKPRLDLCAIEASLRTVQDQFPSINASLDMPRDPLRDEVLDNLLAGYEYVDYLLASDIDLLARGNSRHLLQLNTRVLWGRRNRDAEAFEIQFQETERHFYNDSSAGSARSLMNYAADHDGGAIWTRAAGIYVHVVSAPQLFIEGNHRTGTLIMSQILARAGKPPFVLTAHNAKAYLDSSSLLKGCHKSSLRGMLEIPRLHKQITRVIEQETDPRFVLG